MERDYPMEREMEEKMRQAKMQAEANQAQAGTVGNATPLRESWTGRFRSRLGHSMQESRRAEQLNELLYLLDKHPEIARILDLVDEVGSY